MRSLEKHTEVLHATMGGKKMIGSGSIAVKKHAINTALEACPDGKLYLSGPKDNGLSSTAGLLRRVAAFKIQTKMISMIKPKNILTCV